MSDGFLSRWSRRKREALDEPRPAPPPARSEAPDVAPAGVEAASPAPAPEDEITPEELAQLPTLEELTAETDITAFLRRGVPRALRNAALRRAWALDPKVRDFVCEAREYAYDWNVPGGVPGNGDLLPTDDVAGMIRRIFGDPPPEEVATVDPFPSAGPPTSKDDLRDVVSQSEEEGTPSDVEKAAASPISDDVATLDDTALQPCAVAFEPAAPEGKVLEKALSEFDEGPAAPQRRAEAEAPILSAPRRHGRATPI